MRIFEIFRKKNTPPEPKFGLEKALELMLITNEEFLRLTISRADEELEKFLKEKKLKSKNL
jgi:hypothetical protein